MESSGYVSTSYLTWDFTFVLYYDSWWNVIRGQCLTFAIVSASKWIHQLELDGLSFMANWGQEKFDSSSCIKIVDFGFSIVATFSACFIVGSDKPHTF